MIVRLSYGTAVKMGLKKATMFAEPTTAYIMLGEKCISNCSFCAQRRESPKEGYLSRILWIPYDFEILRNIKGFSRICFQTLDYPNVVGDLIRAVSIVPKIPISISIVPISIEDMKKLRAAGVEGISIALDAANSEIFKNIKGENVGNRFRWETHWRALIMAKKIFNLVNTHIIVGLGESDMDLYNVMMRLSDLGISIALFAYTPLFGGEWPSLERYRAAQLMRYLLFKGHRNFAQFSNGKVETIHIPTEERESLERGVPFITSGCPGCNRPFYNERPGNLLYNYPYLPNKEGIKKIIQQLKGYVKIT